MAYNILDLPNIFSYADKFNVPLNFNFLVDPPRLSVGILTSSDREVVLNHYSKVGFNNEEIINLLNTVKFIDKKTEFINYTKDLDILWNRSILDFIPDIEFLF